MQYFSFIQRYILVNYFIITVTQVFEIQQETNPHRDLLSQSIAQIIFGCVMTTSLNIFILVLVFMLTCTYRRIKMDNRMFPFKVGLNIMSRLYYIFYYIQYFGIRYIVILLLILNPYVTSTALWSILLVFQGLSFIVSTLKLYESKVN